jgi:hypothetical protein
MATSPLDIVGFGQQGIGKGPARLAAREVDQVAFGGVQLDARGLVLQYTAADLKQAIAGDSYRVCAKGL